MRQIIPLLTALLFAAGSICSYADVTIGDLNYTFSKKTATVTGPADKSITEVVIPSKVKDDETTYTVTIIGAEAFSWCMSLTSVTIPSTVKTIERNAFQYCSSLTSVSIPFSVTSIGRSAFSNCISLESVKLPNSLKEIGMNAFYSTNLSEVDIPGSVTSIGECAFGYCPMLKSIKCFSLDPSPIDPYAFCPMMFSDMTHIYDHAILYVPRGCKKKYLKTEGWNKFRCISEISNSDANLDGKTNTTDVISVYSYIVEGGEGVDGIVYENVNGDDVVNTADVVSIYNYIINGEKNVIDLFADEECSDSLRIFKWAITADEKYYTEPERAPLGGFYSMYLSATGNNFSLFIPSDNALKTYYDPVSMLFSQPYMLSFEYDSQNPASPISARAYRYDPLTHQTDYDEPMAVTIPPAQLYNRLKDILDAHIIVHDESEPNGIFSGKSVYNTKGGAPIMVSDITADTIGTKVQGAWQIEHNESCNIQAAFDQSSKTNGYGNGMTYIIDRPLQSNARSIYSVLCTKHNFRSFYKLCQVDPTILEDAGFVDQYPTRKEKDAALNDYMVFASTGSSTDYNVSFLTDHHYTLFVPTNEAMEQAFAKGLPTWEDIRTFIDNAKQKIQAKEESDPDYDPEEDTEAYKTTAQVMCTIILNFVRNHFQRGAVYAYESATTTTQNETECYDAEAGSYHTLTVQLEYRNGDFGLNIIDGTGHICHTTIEKNIMTRDMQYHRQDDGATIIETSSYAVMHSIDHVLDYAPLKNGRYDSYFRVDGDSNNLELARAYLRKYPAKPTPRRAAR